MDDVLPQNRSRRFLRRLAIAGALGWTFGGILPAHADETTRQVQEELRRRYQYFGAIDGRPSDELAAALKSYQKRKSLPLSGQADEPTTRSLGLRLSASSAVPASLPDEPVLRSDAAREITAADQEFLRKLEDGSMVIEPAPAESPAPSEAKEKPMPSTSPAPVATAPETATATPPSPIPPPATPTSPGMDAPALEAFIREYLRDAAADKPDAELGHYADQLDYFDHGKVDHRFVERDVRRYYQRWPERKFTLLRVQVRARSENEATIEFRVRFDLKGKGESATGQTDNSFKVRRTAEGFELIQLRERRVRS